MLFFEWDERKAAANLRKHGIQFEEAAQVFFDEFALSAQDRIVDGEPRWQTVGVVEGILVLVVAHMVWDEGQDEVIRIISARRATRKERIRYEQSREEGGR